MSMQQTGNSGSFPPAYLEQHNDKGVYVVSGVFLAASTLTLVLRLVSRRYKGTIPWGWDDTLVFPAYIFLAALCGFCIGTVKNANVGRHTLAIIAEQGPEGLVPIFKTIVALNFLWLPAVLLPKLSVLCLYLRVFGSIRRVGLWCYLLIASVTADFLAFLIVNALTCRPMNALWDPTVAGHCINAPAVYAASNVPNVVADIGIMVVPLPTLCRLQMPWSKKIGTVVVFLAGSVGLAGSCYRLSMFVKHYIGVETDFAWSILDGLVWSIVEPGMLFVAACLIAMKPLLEHTVRIFSSSSRTGYSSKSKPGTSGVRMESVSKSATGQHHTYGEQGCTRLTGEHHASAQPQQRAPSTDSFLAEGRRDFGVIEVTKDVTVTHSEPV